MRKVILLVTFGLLILLANETSGQRLSPQGGTITSVTMGTGGTGGGASGAVTLNVVATVGGGLTIGADSLGLRTDCSGGNAPVWDGDSWECTDVTTPSELATAVSAAVAGTTNTLAKFTGTNTVGDSDITSTGTANTIGDANTDDNRINGELALNTTISNGTELVILPSAGGSQSTVSIQSNDAKVLTISVSPSSTAASFSSTNGFSFSGAAAFADNVTLGDNPATDTHTINGNTVLNGVAGSAAFKVIGATNGLTDGAIQIASNKTGWGNITGQLTTTAGGSTSTDKLTMSIDSGSLNFSTGGLTNALVIAHAGGGTFASTLDVGSLLSRTGGGDGIYVVASQSPNYAIRMDTTTSPASNGFQLRVRDQLEGDFIIYDETNSATRLYIGPTGLVTIAQGATTPLNWTTTGTGSVVSANDVTMTDDLSVGDDATVTDTLDVNGNLSKFGATDGSTYIFGDQLNFGYANDADAAGAINYNGFAGGTTRFRDLYIYDGKNAAACVVSGSQKYMNCIGGLQENGSAVLSGTIASNTIPKGSGGNLVDSLLVDDSTMATYGPDGTYLTADATIGFHNTTNSVAYGYLNYYGYNHGSTQFRNLIIADGKTATIATFTGSDKSLGVVGNLFTDANFTAGNATSDTHVMYGDLQHIETVGTTLNNEANIRLRDDTAFATGVGGRLDLFGKYNGAGSIAGVVIKAMKTNATDGNYSFDMVLATTPNSSAPTERVRIKDNGDIWIAGSNGIATIGQGLSYGCGTCAESGSIVLYAGDTDGKMRLNSASFGMMLNDGSNAPITAGSGLFKAIGNTQWGDTAASDAHTINGNTVLNGAGAGDAFTPTYSGTAQTADRATINAGNTGTFNVTAAPRASFAVLGQNTATISSGSNFFHVYGVYGSAGVGGGTGGISVGVRGAATSDASHQGQGGYFASSGAGTDIGVIANGADYNFYGENTSGLLFNAGNLQVNGVATLGDTTGDDHRANGSLQVLDNIGTSFITTGSLNTGLMVIDDTAYAAGVGGLINLVGKYNAGGGYADAAQIKAFKTNGTDGNYSFDLAFGTRVNGGNVLERMRIFDTGDVAIATTTDNGYKLYVNGTTRLAGNTTIGFNATNTHTITGTLTTDESVTLGDGSDDTIAFNGDTVDATGWFTGNGGSAQTVDRASVYGNNNSSADTSGGNRIAAGVWGNGQSTEAGGANTLINVGVMGSATGGEENYAFYVSGNTASKFYSATFTNNVTVQGTTTLTGATNTIGDSATDLTTFINGFAGINTYAGTHLEWADDWFNADASVSSGSFGPYYLQVSGGDMQAGPIVSGRPGIAQLQTGTGTTGYAAMMTNPVALSFATQTMSTFEAALSVATLSTAGQEYTVIAGFWDVNNSADQVDGCYFMYDRGDVAANPGTGDTGGISGDSWSIWCSQNSTRTGYKLDGTASEDSFTTITSTVAASTYYRLKVDVDFPNNKARFYINGTEVGRITSNIPNGATTRMNGAGWKILKSAGTTSRTVNVDQTRLAVDLSAAR